MQKKTLLILMSEPVGKIVHNNKTSVAAKTVLTFLPSSVGLYIASCSARLNWFYRKTSHLIQWGILTWV